MARRCAACVDACADGSVRAGPPGGNALKNIAFSGLLLIAGLLLEHLHGLIEAATLIFLIVAACSGRAVLMGAVSDVLCRRIGMNFLMTVASAGAFLIGHAEEGAAIMFLYGIAEYLEDYAEDRARNSVKEMMELAPDTARVIRDGKESTVPVEKINVGETIIVRPGDAIPLDGAVVKGSTSVNQASITGESVPVEKRAGDEVFAGTLNGEGFLEVRVEKRSCETVLSRIIKLVSEAQEDKTIAERFIDRFARVYTPSVVLLALLVAVVPVLLFGRPASVWAYRALTLLVVSCPCALILATPVAVVSAITSSARNGVLIKGGSFIEEASKTKVIALDKTGTLTEGEPSVTRIIPFACSGERLLSVAASLESRSKHPLSKAIMKEAGVRKIVPKEAEDFWSKTGKGLCGTVDGVKYCAGSHEMFEEMGLKCPESVCPVYEAQGKTIILVGTENELLGALVLSDRLRDTSREAINAIKKRGIKTVMLTGDNARAAKAIADQTGIDSCKAQLDPSGKVGCIDALRKEHGHVVMVGDGVNDAPALAKASVGVAMGNGASHAALETADIALIKEDLRLLPYLIDLSRRTDEVVKENVGIAIIVKGGFAVLTVLGMTQLWMAVAFGDMGLTLVVMLNSMRIAWIRPKWD